ncbi:rhomboid family intramembrane serine protease [Allobacillus saliphilus]|nr:rhomboid family intramembrane serine protease [Allobacillus saliphilus]
MVLFSQVIKMFFVRTENFQQFIRYYPVITALAAIHLILFIMTEVIPLNIFLDLKALLLGNNYLVRVEGEYWRLFTPIFLHLSLTHVVFNTFSLVLFGPALEVMLGKVKFILAYLFMGIIGNVFTLFVGPLLMSHAGASGAIFGIFGLYLYLSFFRRDLIDHQSRQVILVIIVISLIMTFTGANINVYAHLFGLIAGVALGPIVFGNK